MPEPLQRDGSSDLNANATCVVELESQVAESVGAHRLTRLGELAGLLRLMDRIDDATSVLLQALRVRVGIGHERYIESTQRAFAEIGAA